MTAISTTGQEHPDIPTPAAEQPKPQRRLYFVNEIVEWQLTQYLWSGCTKVDQRDRIMAHATELIRQIIRKQGLHTIYPGQEESAFGDLLQTAWVQIERTLYKYRAKPHCRGCFNPDRPGDSALYQPGDTEYGIKTVGDLVDAGIETCARCRRMLTPEPLLEARQGTYGGTDTVLYRGVSKVFNMWCVAPDTMLQTCHGPLFAADVVEHFEAGLPVHVDGLNGLSPVRAVKLRDAAPTLRLTTECGYELECSPEHRLYTHNEDGLGWSESSRVRVGDLVAIRCGQRQFADHRTLADVVLTRRGDWQRPAEIDDELAYMIGVYIAKGSFSHGKLAICDIDDGVAGRLVENRLGLNFVREPEYRRVSLCNVRFVELLQQLGFPSNPIAQAKSIPPRLLCLPERLLASLLRGMFDGDGHSRERDGLVGYTTTSPLLLAQLRMILLNFGIISKLKGKRGSREPITGAGRRTGGPAGAARLLLPPRDSRTFYDLIGFGLSRKDENRQRLRPIRDFVHGLNDRFRSLYRRYGAGSAGHGRVGRMLRAGKCTVDTARAALRCWSAHAHDEDYVFAAGRLAAHTADRDRLVWTPVRSVATGRSELLDFAVDAESHSYVANGLVVHNSQIARTVILAYIKKEGRDRKNSPSYTSYLDNRTRPVSDTMLRFLSEARELCRYNDQHLQVLDSVEWLLNNDEKPYDGIIGKLVDHSGLPRATVTGMMKLIRMRSFEFTDSPLNRELDASRSERRRVTYVEFEDE